MHEVLKSSLALAHILSSFQFSSVQSLSHVQLFVTPWTAARQASLSITNSWSSPKLMCIKSVIPSSHLILCCPLLLLLPIPPSIRVFSNESTLRTRWPNTTKTLKSINFLETQVLFFILVSLYNHLFNNCTTKSHMLWVKGEIFYHNITWSMVKLYIF